MLILRGAPALSEFRIKQLLKNCHTAALPVTDVYAEYVHFADVSKSTSDAGDHELTTDDADKLIKLLTYGPTIAEHVPVGRLLFVTPRRGTISPWSSKATDIAHNCGLTQIKRLERGIAFYVQSDAMDQAKVDALANLLHDRMMETVFEQLEDAQVLFKSELPRQMTNVDILSGGREALVKANVEQGFALALSLIHI